MALSASAASVMGGGLSGHGDEHVATVVAELERAGYTASDRMQLRFSFGVPALRVAADLAMSLRMGGFIRVQVRPAVTRLLSAQRWTVIATTHPAPLMHAVIRLWQDQMVEVARSHPGCTVMGWEPVATRTPPG